MYAPDLSPYPDAGIRWRIWRRSKWPILLNIGWLASEHPYPQGDPDVMLLDKLFQLTTVPFARRKGLHECPFCDCNWIEEIGGYEATHHGSKLLLGNAELWIPTSSRIVFVAPTMVFHYIRDHRYLPPFKFIEAVRATDSAAIRKLRKSLAEGFD